MPAGELFEVRAEEWHPVMDPREAQEEMQTKTKRDALAWEEFEGRDENDEGDEGEDEEDAPKPTSSAAAAKPPTVTIAATPTAPAITPAPAAEDDDDEGDDEDDKPKSSSTVQKNVTSSVPAPPAVSAPSITPTASRDDDDDDDDDDETTTKSSSTVTTTVSSSSKTQAQSTITSTVQPISTVPKPQSQTAPSPLPPTPTTLVTSVSTTGNIIGLPASSQGSRNGASLSSSSSSIPATVPSSATAGISDTSNNASTISAVVLAIIIGTFAVILPFAIYFFWRRKSKKRASASNFTFVNPPPPTVPAVYVAPETSTSIINNPFGDSHALNFNGQERGERRSRGVSGTGQRARSVRGSGLSEEVVEWMTGKAKIINVGNIKGREVVEEKEVENEMAEKVEMGKRESWEDAESLVMNEKSVRSVAGKKRAESLIEEPTGRREVELGVKEERRNNTKSVAF